jgi:hypothetical protein
MKTINYHKTLFYYDGPQIIEGRDSIGGHYIAVMLNAEGQNDRYMVIGVEPEKLRQFRSGTLDLRRLLDNGDQDNWYTTTVKSGLQKPLELEPQQIKLSESGLLPDDGFVLHDHPSEEIALKEARERHNLVFEVAVEPPEAADSHRIRVDTLIDLLAHVQTMIKHAYGAALRELSNDLRRAIDKTDAHLLNVIIPAAPGSFRVIMEAAQPPDMLGQSELARALGKIDRLFADAADPQKTLETARNNRGHLAGAYLRLLRFLVNHKTGLRYSWAEPEFSESSNHSVTEGQAGPLVDVLSGVANLGSETVVLVGAFEKANRGTGTWGILTEDGVLSGKLRDGGPSLEGLKIGSRYKFECIEEIEVVEGTGREQRSLYLVQHEPA